jgi:hypothetical protein
MKLLRSAFCGIVLASLLMVCTPRPVQAIPVTDFGTHLRIWLQTLEEKTAWIRDYQQQIREYVEIVQATRSVTGMLNYAEKHWLTGTETTLFLAEMRENINTMRRLYQTVKDAYQTTLIGIRAIRTRIDAGVLDASWDDLKAYFLYRFGTIAYDRTISFAEVAERDPELREKIDKYQQNVILQAQTKREIKGLEDKLKSMTETPPSDRSPEQVQAISDLTRQIDERNSQLLTLQNEESGLLDQIDAILKRYHLTAMMRQRLTSEIVAGVTQFAEFSESRTQLEEELFRQLADSSGQESGGPAGEEGGQ